MRLGPAAWRATLVVALSACVEGPGGPGRFGEVSVEPAYRAGYEPGAIGISLDTASVVVGRRGTGERLLDSKVPYAGGAISYVLDLQADEESLDVAVELWSGGTRRYRGDTVVVVESGAVGSGQSHDMAVAYVGPPIVSSVTVTPATATLTALGATRQFAAEARDPDHNVVPGATFTWASSTGSVATVDAATGLATAAGDGSTTITATSGSASGSADLAVKLPPVVATVAVMPGSVTLTALGATQPFTAEARDGSGSVVPGVTFTWTSSKSSVATIDGTTGLAIAVGHGSSTITATTGTVSGTATLDVNLAATVTTVVVTPAQATLTALGATQQFTAEARDANGNLVPGVTFAWASSNTSTATIDPTTGLATAAGNGSATITGTTGGVEGSAQLTVSQDIIRIVVSPDSATLIGGEQLPTQRFIAEARDMNGNLVAGASFVWASSNPTVASVDATGLATGVGFGSATISATARGVTGFATLIVNRPH